MAQQYLAENCLNTGGALVTQGLSTSIINVNDPQGVSVNQLNIDRTGGVPQDGGYIIFGSIPYISRGKISIDRNNLVIESGDNDTLDNGNVTIPELLIIAPQTFLKTTNTTLQGVGTIANVDEAFLIDLVDTQDLTQGNAYELNNSKLVFNYDYDATQPNFIDLYSDLFKLGMIFLKDKNGVDVLVADLDLDLESDPPLLKISNIQPIDGVCSAMLCVI